MKLVKKILDKFNGFHYPQEYLCLAKESFQEPIHVYLVSGNKIIKDITNHHLFIGYSPLIFAFSMLGEIDLSKAENITVLFSQTGYRLNEILNSKDALATIRFEKMKDKFVSYQEVHLYEGHHAEYRF